MAQAQSGSIWAVLFSGTALLWAATATHAQDQQAPLAGPTVEVREVPGVEARYVPGAAGRMAGPEAAVPLPVFFDALRSLDADGTPAPLRMTGEQREKIVGLVRDFGREVADFVETSGAEVRGLVAQLPQSERGRAAGELRGLEQLTRVLDRFEQADNAEPSDRRRVQRPDRDQPQQARQRRDELVEGLRLRFERSHAAARNQGMADEMAGMTDEAPADARARLAELRAAAPSPAALQTRVWTLLTPAQRDHLGPMLEASMAEARTQREEARLARTIEQRRAAQRDAAPSDRAPTDAAPAARAFDLSDEALDRLLAQLDAGQIPERLWANLPERTRQRLEALPEAQRAPAVARLLRSRKSPGG